MRVRRGVLWGCGLASLVLYLACGGAAAPSARPLDVSSGRATPSPIARLADPASRDDADASRVPAVSTPVAEPPADVYADTPPEAGSSAASIPAATAPPHASDASPVPLHPFLPAPGRPRTVVLDPGHGGPEIGAAGAGVLEKDINLRIARELRDLLERDGMRVVLTRDGDRRAAEGAASPGYSATRIDLQARLDLANAAGADAFISIHNNGSPNPSDAGAEVWWDGRRPFAAYNQALAEQVRDALVGAIRATGYPVGNRGLKEDSQFRVFRGRAFPIFVLGPPRTGVTTSRAGLMPAVLGETLFLSNPVEAPQLTRESVLSAIARGYQEGLRRYFRLIDDGLLALPPAGLPPDVPNRYDVTPPAGSTGG